MSVCVGECGGMRMSKEACAEVCGYPLCMCMCVHACLCGGVYMLA